jgi:predicted outer membrane repeat protein
MIRDLWFTTEYSFYQFNTADTGDGGSLYLSWSIDNKKSAEFVTYMNSFDSDTAKSKGGAIYYDLFSPKNLKNNTFKNNIASYGKDYASYPFQLKLLSDDGKTVLASSEDSSVELMKVNRS